MAADSSRSIKVIAFLGFLVFGFLWLSSFGLKKSLEPDESQRVPERAARSPFDGDAAFAHAGAIAALGPRPAGSDTLQKAADDLTQRLRGAGLSVEDKAGVIVARVPGAMPASVALVAHLGSGPDGPGANADASGAALAAEMLRACAGSRRQHGLVGLWLLDSADPTQADALRATLEAEQARAVFVLGAVGDCYLRMASDQAAPQWMRDFIDDQATQFALPPHFPEQGMPIEDTLGLHAWHKHACYIADAMNGTLATHNQRTGTALDTMEHVCPQSLQAVGDVLYHALAACDSYLTQLPQ